MSCSRPWGAGVVAATMLAGVISGGCTKGPRPIRYGKDECVECKMTLVDPHYGAEHVSARGKVQVFDDVNCLTAFLRRSPEREALPAQSVVVDFQHPGRLLPVEQAFFLHHPGLRSPMASSLGAFSNEADLEAAHRQLGGGGRRLRWPEVRVLPP